MTIIIKQGKIKPFKERNNDKNDKSGLKIVKNRLFLFIKKFNSKNSNLVQSKTSSNISTRCRFDSFDLEYLKKLATKASNEPKQARFEDIFKA